MEKHTLAFCLALCFGMVGNAEAQISKVNSRAALAGNTTVEWFAFGKDGGFVSTPLSRHFGAVKVTVASSSGGLILQREGTTWHGDFIPGQFLLTQPYQSDNFLVSFSPPVLAVGTQIDPGNQQNGHPPYIGRFTARLCLYGAQGAYLGTVATTSNANAAEDGSAHFIGARSAGEPIGRVSLLVSGVTAGFSVEGDLAANQMDVVVPLKPTSASPGPALTPPPGCQ